MTDYKNYCLLEILYSVITFSGYIILQIMLKPILSFLCGIMTMQSAETAGRVKRETVIAMLKSCRRI